MATSQRILIVDDDRSSCEILSKILALRGYRVDVAFDGYTALELIREQDYGLALIDYRMPGMDGVELYRRIRELRPELVGVFVTGFPTIDTVYPAIAVGVERVIAKPAGSGELLSVIEEFVGKPGSGKTGGFQPTKRTQRKPRGVGAYPRARRPAARQQVSFWRPWPMKSATPWDRFARGHGSVRPRASTRPLPVGPKD